MAGNGDEHSGFPATSDSFLPTHGLRAGKFQIMSTMTEEEFETALAFATRQKLAVLSTVSTEGQPQSALMGVAITPDFEIVFDTLATTRKYDNLRANRRVALVIGCANAVTLQYEGIAEELQGDQL